MITLIVGSVGTAYTVGSVVAAWMWSRHLHPKTGHHDAKSVAKAVVICTFVPWPAQLVLIAIMKGIE
jgi:hypothetical protein